MGLEWSRTWGSKTTLKLLYHGKPLVADCHPNLGLSVSLCRIMRCFGSMMVDGWCWHLRAIVFLAAAVSLAKMGMLPNTWQGASPFNYENDGVPVALNLRTIGLIWYSSLIQQSYCYSTDCCDPIWVQIWPRFHPPGLRFRQNLPQQGFDSSFTQCIGFLMDFSHQNIAISLFQCILRIPWCMDCMDVSGGLFSCCTLTVAKRFDILQVPTSLRSYPLRSPWWCPCRHSAHSMVEYADGVRILWSTTVRILNTTAFLIRQSQLTIWCGLGDFSTSLDTLQSRYQLTYSDLSPFV